MATEQVRSELEQKLEGFIARAEPCLIVVTKTNFRNSRENNFVGKTRLVYKKEREPMHWASYAEHNFGRFPLMADVARRELTGALDYQRNFDQNIQIEVLPSEEYKKRYPKVRSVYGA